MRKIELQFIKDSMEIENSIYGFSIKKNAQEGVASVLGSVKDYVKGIYDPNNPVESVLSFFTPGILWILGFKKLAIVYEIAQAFGFNWTKFFSSIKEKLRPFVSGLVEGKQGDASTINNIVESSAEESFTDTLNPSKLFEAVIKNNSFRNDICLNKTAIRYQADSNLMHNLEKWMNAAIGNRMRKGILGFIVRIMSWIIAAALISVGFAVAGGVASKILDIGKKHEDTATNSTPQNTEGETVSDKPKSSTQQTSGKNVVLHLNPEADPHLKTTTYNDNNHVWLLNINVSDIKNQLIDWAQELYPQLTNISAFETSSSFNRTLKMFQERNKNTQLEMLAVPVPFTSIKQIVDSFAADVASHM